MSCNHRVLVKYTTVQHVHPLNTCLTYYIFQTHSLANKETKTDKPLKETNKQKVFRLCTSQRNQDNRDFTIQHGSLLYLYEYCALRRL